MNVLFFDHNLPVVGGSTKNFSDLFAQDRRGITAGCVHRPATEAELLDADLLVAHGPLTKCRPLFEASEDTWETLARRNPGARILCVSSDPQSMDRLSDLAPRNIALYSRHRDHLSWEEIESILTALSAGRTLSDILSDAAPTSDALIAWYLLLVANNPEKTLSVLDRTRNEAIQVLRKRRHPQAEALENSPPDKQFSLLKSILQDEFESGAGK